MGTYTLVIANKNYSSWSMRGWLALRLAGVEFDEIVIPLQVETTKTAIAEHSPSGLVPALNVDGVTIWDSLAIAETIAERHPDTPVWPADPGARGVARSVAAEMHSGFRALRTEMPMNIRASHPGHGLTPDVETDIRRIADIWRDCRARFGDGGPYLFGEVSAADAFYAPVVTRFRTYGVALDDVCQAYSDAVYAWPAVAEWCAAAEDEPWHIAGYDPT